MCQITEISKEMKKQLPEKKEGEFNISLKGLGFMAFEDRWPLNALEDAAKRIDCTVECYRAASKESDLEVTLSAC
jgi:hypothetical protein